MQSPTSILFLRVGMQANRWIFILFKTRSIIVCFEYSYFGNTFICFQTKSGQNQMQVSLWRVWSYKEKGYNSFFNKTLSSKYLQANLYRSGFAKDIRFQISLRFCLEALASLVAVWQSLLEKPWKHLLPVLVEFTNKGPICSAWAETWLQYASLESIMYLPAKIRTG